MRRSIFWYGLSLAALLVFLKSIEYQYMVRDLSREAFIAVIGGFFLVLGVWAGISISAKFQDRKRRLAVTTPGKGNPGADGNPLSEREIEVLKLMAGGMSNREIAETLHISMNTVKTHISNLYGKLDVSRRTQAVHRARELEIIELTAS